MRKIIVPLIIIAIIPALGCATYDIKITNDEIKKKLDSRFPITKHYLFIFDITYKNPEVILLDGSDKVFVAFDAGLDIRLKSQSKPLSGSAGALCGIDFRPDTGRLFLADCQITKLQIVGIPDEYLEEVNKVTNLVAKELLDKYPVYTLKPTEAKSSSDKLVVKNVVIRNGVLIITVGI